MQSGSMVGSQPGGGVLAFGAPSVLKSTPAEAVVSLDMTVLLMSLTFSASTSETPPPSQPATLFAMMLLVTVTSYQRPGFPALGATSVPLTPCRRRPPPLPLSAVLPRIRFESIISPRPTPSERLGRETTTTPPLSHARPSRGAPPSRLPPPVVGKLRLALPVQTS